MTIVFVLHLLVVGTIAAVAATFADRAARRLRLPTRYVWMGALVFTAAVPLLSFAAERAAGVRQDVAPAASVSQHVALPLDMEWAQAQESALIPELVLPSWAARVDFAVLCAWAVVSLLALVRLWVSHRRLRMRSTRWQAVRMFGTRVRLTPGEGPAVVGLLEPEILVPGWALESPPSVVRLMLAHENEHVRARDPLLLFLADLAVSLAPWHPALYWQRRQLRLAVEMDCDARVLRSHRNTRSYAELLLRVAQRPANTSGLLSAAVALAPRPSTLERRISAMTEKRTRRPLAALVAAGAAALLTIAACEAPRATAPVPEREIPMSEIALQLDRVEADSGVVLTGSPSLTIIADSVLVVRGREVRDSIHVLRMRGEVDAEEPMVALHVVDGVIVRSMKDLEGMGIRPEDIESVEVVKGRAAQRIYGPDAVAGVVAIRLKDGESPPARTSPLRRVPGVPAAPPDAGEISEVPVRLRQVPPVAGRVSPAAVPQRAPAAERPVPAATASGVRMVPAAPEAAVRGVPAAPELTIEAVPAAPSRTIERASTPPDIAVERAPAAPKGFVTLDGDTALLRASPSSEARPIIIIDGVIMSMSGPDALNSIAPERIKSVEVLKGEAAARIYGARGANGVIVITTKGGGGGGGGDSR